MHLTVVTTDAIQNARCATSGRIRPNRNCPKVDPLMWVLKNKLKVSIGRKICSDRLYRLFRRQADAHRQARNLSQQDLQSPFGQGAPHCRGALPALSDLRHCDAPSSSTRLNRLRRCVLLRQIFETLEAPFAAMSAHFWCCAANDCVPTPQRCVFIYQLCN
jgi:hypothetical protein